MINEKSYLKLIIIPFILIIALLSHFLAFNFIPERNEINLKENYDYIIDN